MAVGILLVGGFGTRLMPLTSETPKPMLPVAGIPVTEHQIMAAKAAGIHTLVLATSYLADVFTPYFGDGSRWGIKILYAVEKEPLGTGGAIRNAAQNLDLVNLGDEPIIIFNGDVLSRHSIAQQIRFHQSKNADVTIHLIDVEDARAFGCVPTDSQGRVTAFLEKWRTPLLNPLTLAATSSIRECSMRFRLAKLSVLNAKHFQLSLKTIEQSTATRSRRTGSMWVHRQRSSKAHVI